MEQFHPVIKRLLEKKGLTGQKLVDFLSWDLKSLPDLTQMKDLKKASERIIQALINNEKIGIYGDYDVDGTTSCALFYHFFKNLDELSTNVELIQPSRFVEGYGLHLSSIDQAVEKGIKVLITVDCGISNNEAADYALQKGIDLIITDHHKDAREEMPKAYAVVNPNRRDETNEDLKPLAGVAVAFAVCVEIRNQLLKKNYQIPSVYPLLQFVAIGTICDLASLNHVNLKLVRHGLKQLKETEFIGLRQFFTNEELQAKQIPAEKLSFQIGPLINSKGRLDHPEMALKLLTTSRYEVARECYEHLKSCNTERKFIQSEVFNEAKTIFAKSLDDTDPLIAILYQPHWHEGVIGIVASKIVESFGVPAIIFTDADHEGIIKASARSAGELDIFKALKHCEDLFIKFGGHKAAAGLSMNKENLQPFVQKMREYLKNIPAIMRTNNDFYDLEIEASEIDPRLMRELDLLEPFGMGNSKPIFKMNNVDLESYDILQDSHVRWNFRQNKIKMKGISFNYLGKPLALKPTEAYSLQQQKRTPISITFSLSLNRFNGNESIQLMVDKVEI